MSLYREEVLKRLTRSSKWPSFIKKIKKEVGRCAVCAKRKGLEGHHIRPFHIYPDLELNPDNITILCRRHHFILGHLEYWKSYNPQMAETISYFRSLLIHKP